jgi:hypothetical protein
VFGLVHSNSVTNYTPGPNALYPFLLQISIEVTAMLQLVLLTLLKSLQEGPELAIQVLVIYNLLPRCTEGSLSLQKKDMYVRKDEESFAVQRTLHCAIVSLLFWMIQVSSLSSNDRQVARNRY